MIFLLKMSFIILFAYKAIPESYPCILAGKVSQLHSGIANDIAS